jgi:hypothetical protein
MSYTITFLVSAPLPLETTTKNARQTLGIIIGLKHVLDQRSIKITRDLHNLASLLREREKPAVPDVSPSIYFGECQDSHIHAPVLIGVTIHLRSFTGRLDNRFVSEYLAIVRTD